MNLLSSSFKNSQLLTCINSVGPIDKQHGQSSFNLKRIYQPDGKLTDEATYACE